MILSNVKTKSLWSIFCKCAKKIKNDTGQLQFLSCAKDTKLLLAPPHECHKFACFFSSILSKCLLPIFLCFYPFWVGRSHQHELQTLLSSPPIYDCCCVMPGPAFFNKKSRLFGLTPVKICCYVLLFSRGDLFQMYITFYYYLYPK